MDLTVLAQVITAIIATFAFLLSIYSLYLRRKDKQPQIHVNLSYGFPVYHDGRSTRTMLSASIGNAGEVKVNVTSLTFPIGGKAAFIFQPEGTAQIPFELAPSHGETFWADTRELASVLKAERFQGKVKLRACFGDAIGNKYCSKKFDFDIDAWLGERD